MGAPVGSSPRGAAAMAAASCPPGEAARAAGGVPGVPPPRAYGGERPRVVTVLHFTDVYNLESGTVEPVGGAARLATAVRTERERATRLGRAAPLLAFGGDVFAPSLASTVFKGEQMVPVMNALGVDCACVGNHDFDHGLDVATRRLRECDAPFLCANVMDRATGEPLGGCGRTWSTRLDDGVRVGFVGLAEEEWLATMPLVAKEDVSYEDFVLCGRRHARELRADGCDVVIALTHMRTPNDERLASEVPEFDAVLGGHDHNYLCERVEGTLVCKSGTEFRWLTRLTLTLPPAGELASRPPRAVAEAAVAEQIFVTSDVPEEPGVAAIVKRYADKMGAAMDVRLGHTLVPLDGRFDRVRLFETNLGNLVCDLLRLATGADCVLINSGTLRSDVLHPAGELTVRDLTAMLPMLDETIVIEINGDALVRALENGVCMWPRLEGRFPQVSGMEVEFDAGAEAGKRVRAVRVCGAEVDPGRLYTVCTKSYLADGKDGYECLKGSRVVVSAEEAPLLPTLMRAHFETLAGLRGVEADATGAERTLREAEGASGEASRRRLSASFLAGTPLCRRAEPGGPIGVAPELEGRIVARNVPECMC